MIAEPPIVQQAERVKVWMRLFVLFAVVAGIAAIVAAPVVDGAEGLVLGIALAAGAWMGAAVIHLDVARDSATSSTHPPRRGG